MNCQTAIEAVMIGKEAISVEWINTPHLKIQGPPGNISHRATNLKNLVNYVEKITKRQKINSK